MRISQYKICCISFYMKTNILQEFHICISVPLNKSSFKAVNLCDKWHYLLSYILWRHCMDSVTLVTLSLHSLSHPPLAVLQWWNTIVIQSYWLAIWARIMNTVFQLKLHVAIMQLAAFLKGIVHKGHHQIKGEGRYLKSGTNGDMGGRGYAQMVT